MSCIPILLSHTRINATSLSKKSWMDIHTNSMTDRWINWTGWISYNPFNSFVKAIILESYFPVNKRTTSYPAHCRDSHPPLCVEENHNSLCLPPTKPCWSTHYCCTITGAQDYERPIKYTDCFVIFHFVEISSVSVIYVNDLSRFFRVTSLAFGQWYNCPSDSEVWAQSTSRKHEKAKIAIWGWQTPQLPRTERP